MVSVFWLSVAAYLNPLLAKASCHVPMDSPVSRLRKYFPATSAIAARAR
jgi:hypothetical protein